ncbi:MAG: MCE family protein [Bdellovibrionaceae bacterium]|nr:MCE family protein [Pseudobdellovibrionaceae bacterium]
MFKFSRWKFRLSVAVWLFPVFALILTAWLALDYWRERGALVEIRFPDAANIEAQKTMIKYRGINVGRVEEVELSGDQRQVVVRARMQRSAHNLVVEGTSFQVIEPQVGLGGISGLDTLFKGVYIDLTPGPKDAPLAQKFTGRQITASPFASGFLFTLRSKYMESIGDGDPVIYRGLKIGQVISVRLDEQARFVEARIRVPKTYARLVRENTQFWFKRAVQADVGLLGASVQISSMESLMKGGVQMATPEPAGKIAAPGAKFNLLDVEPKGWREWSPNLASGQSVARAQ